MIGDSGSCVCRIVLALLFCGYLLCAFCCVFFHIMYYVYSQTRLISHYRDCYMTLNGVNVNNRSFVLLLHTTVNVNAYMQLHNFKCTFTATVNGL